MKLNKAFYLIILCPLVISAQSGLGSFSYEDFKTPKYCGSACHTDFYQQWKQAMMSQAYTHEWDEIEYFKLAVPHADKDEKVAEVKAGCNGCHSPIAYLAGDVPPPPPSKNSRANESVSCDVCHSISGFAGDIPYNYNYIMKPGKVKFSSRKPSVESPAHEIEVNSLLKSGDFCGICHNEKSPYGAWVKTTHLEWKEGPYSKEGVQCQDCHMPKAEMKTASMGAKYSDARLHLFHGAHDPGKIRGAIELRINPDINEVEPGNIVKFTVALFNQKTGHKFPTGSVEDRIVWLHVEAIDSKGNVYHIPVDKKGFEGEEFTIASDVLAYQDLGIALNIPDFKGVKRDGIPIGDRIFRMPYFDPQGRMTIQQWNTASLGVDYRIGPRETKIETFTFKVPANVPPGKLKVTATLNYQLLVKPVADFLGVPESESQIVKVNEHSTEITILQ
ncbi:MAG: NapC/NirT family cytochrome c [Melioribacter sp.]|nr:NapC/NirT family cytochrome c [Melioribacter sp.]